MTDTETKPLLNRSLCPFCGHPDIPGRVFLILSVNISAHKWLKIGEPPSRTFTSLRG
jgi:hypothetical protein